MSAGQRPPDARPIFRTLAIGVAFVCFILAVVFGSSSTPRILIFWSDKTLGFS